MATTILALALLIAGPITTAAQLADCGTDRECWAREAERLRREAAELHRQTLQNPAPASQGAGGLLSRQEEAERDAYFSQAAYACAGAAGVRVDVKPGRQITFLGTRPRNFAFEKCMTDAGMPITTYSE